jgi:membrane protein DedA with SNARE-associated domain
MFDTLKALMKDLIDWYLATLDTYGYPLIVLLMAAESSVVPLPSEVVIPPAAHLAHTKGNMSLLGIVIAGTLGSWIGASIMYWAARSLGRPLILRYGKYVLITAEKVRGAEAWARQFGSVGIFISRLLPVVRHLIGIPAGIVQMNFKLYSAFTVLGSAIWCTVLCWVGVKAGNDQKLLAGDVHRIGIWLGGAMIVLGGIYYFFVHRHMKRASTSPQQPKPGSSDDGG